MKIGKTEAFGAPLSVFTIVTLAFLLFPTIWERWNVDKWEVIGANGLLCLLSIINASMHFKAIKNPNPNVFSTSVMASTVLKMFVLGSAAMLYIALSGKNRNIPGLFLSMGLYVVYTVLDVRANLKMNQKA